MPGIARPKTSSLTLRLCAVLATGAVALSALVTLSGAEEAKDRQVRALHAQQRLMCDSLARRAAALLEREDALRLSVDASSAADIASARVLILDRSGVVKIDTGQAEQGHVLQLATSDGLADRPLGAERFEVMAPALSNDGFVGEVRLRYTTRGLPPVEFPWSLFGLVFLCSATLVTLAGWIVHSWVLRLRQLAAHARNLARGESAEQVGRDAGAVGEVREALLELSLRGEQSAQNARGGFLRLARELIHALELRGQVAPGRPERVRRQAVALAEHLELDALEVATIGEAAVVLELGKAGIRPSALAKEGRLDEIELESLREAPSRGASLLGALPELAEVARAVRHHRERWDGTGHPDGLRGARIPVASRVLAIASTWDQLLLGDGRMPSLSWPEALDVLREQSGAIFDPNLVRSFEEMVRAKPPRERGGVAVAIPTPALALAEASRIAPLGIDACESTDEVGEDPESPLELMWDDPDGDES